MASGGALDRCEVECRCQHPSSDQRHRVWLYIQTDPRDGHGRAKNSLHYKELSLWIVRVRVDTAAGLHLALYAIQLITPCLCIHICIHMYMCEDNKTPR